MVGGTVSWGLKLFCAETDESLKAIANGTSKIAQHLKTKNWVDQVPRDFSWVAESILAPRFSRGFGLFSDVLGNRIKQPILTGRHFERIANLRQCGFRHGDGMNRPGLHSQQSKRTRYCLPLLANTDSIWVGRDQQKPGQGGSMIALRGRSLVTSYSSICLCFFLFAGWASAQENSAVDVILKQRWDRSSENRRFEFAVEIGDDRVSAMTGLAWVVNRINQFDYDSALETVETVTEQYPKLLDAWYCQAWLQIRAGKIDQGLVSIQSYRKQMDQANLTPEEKAVHLRRMGRLCGYVDGPANSKANPEIIQATLDRATDGLNAAGQTAFADQYHNVMDQFSQMMDNREDINQQAMADAVAKQKQDLANLQQESANLAKEESGLYVSAEKVNEARTERITKLEEQVGPLQSQANRLDDLLYEIDCIIQDLVRDEFLLRDRIDREEDPHYRNLLLSRLSAIQVTINREQFRRRSVHNEIRGIVAEINQLHNEAVRVNQLADAQLNNLNNELTSVQKQQRKNSARTKRTSKTPNPRDSKATSISKRVRFVGTFDPFPTESLKQAILDEFE